MCSIFSAVPKTENKSSKYSEQTSCGQLAETGYPA